jgi:hypothetical protein
VPTGAVLREIGGMNRKFPQLSSRCSLQIITEVCNFSYFGSQTNYSTCIESHCVSAEVTNLLTADNARGGSGQAAERASRRHHGGAR